MQRTGLAVCIAWLLVSLAGSVEESSLLRPSSNTETTTNARDLLLRFHPKYERHKEDAYSRYIVCVDETGPNCDAASTPDAIAFVGSDVVNPAPHQFRYQDTGPADLQGVFYFRAQGPGFSTLMSFAKTRQGAGVAAGELGNQNGFAYLITPQGDHNWAFGGNDDSSVLTSTFFDRLFDVLYQFQLVGGTLDAPTNFRLVTEGKLISNCIRVSVWTFVWNFFVRVTMDLITDPSAPERLDYPGSVVWSRQTRNLFDRLFPFTTGLFPTEQLDYLLVQIIDGNGNRIDPAYEEFRTESLRKFGNLVQFSGLQEDRVGDYLTCGWPF